MRDKKELLLLPKKKNPNRNEFKLLSTTGALHQVLHSDRFHFHSSRLHNGRLVFLSLESHFSRLEVEVSDRSVGLSQVSEEGGAESHFAVASPCLAGACGRRRRRRRPCCFDKWISAVITSDRRCSRGPMSLLYTVF